MRYFVVALAALALTSCKKENPAPAEAPPAAAAEPSANENGTQAEAPAAAEPEEAKVAVNAELVGKFVAYQKAVTAAAQAETAKFEAEAKKAEGSGGTAKMLAAAGSIEANMDQHKEAARKSAGISEAEIEAVSDVVRETVFIHKSALEQKPTTDKSIADMKKQLADHPEYPAEQKKGIEDMIAALESSRKTNLELTNARAKHGDAAVDGVLAHEDELYAMQKQAMGMR